MTLNLHSKVILKRFEVVFWCLEWESCTFQNIDGNSFKSTNTIMADFFFFGGERNGRWNTPYVSPMVTKWNLKPITYTTLQAIYTLPRCDWNDDHLWTDYSSSSQWRILPYFGKRKHVTYHLNMSYWCFYDLLNYSVFFFQSKFYA